MNRYFKSVHTASNAFRMPIFLPSEYVRGLNDIETSYLFSVQDGSGPSASAKEPKKSGHLTIDKRRRVIYIE